MIQVESSLHTVDKSAIAGNRSDPVDIWQALDVCDRALTFAEPDKPWLALRSLLREHRSASNYHGSRLVTGSGTALHARTLRGEPLHVGNEKSAMACFQWGLLCNSQGRTKRAIEWLQRSVWLDWSNYWYQFSLADLLNEDGLSDDALNHYSTAVACQPDAPWVRLKRARVYRTKGRWSWALDDLLTARRLMGSRPESFQVSLEIGLLHWSLGDFSQAASEFRSTIASAPESTYACSARLYLAKIDAESGREERAAATYEELLRKHPEKSQARLSRANLNLRLGRPEAALSDLNMLLNPDVKITDLDEVLATRAIALLLSNRRAEAVE